MILIILIFILFLFTLKEPMSGFYTWGFPDRKFYGIRGAEPWHCDNLGDNLSDKSECLKPWTKERINRDNYMY